MRLRVAALLVLLLTGVAAQTPPAADRFYQAIRQNDLTVLRTLIRDERVNAKDAQGQTPLMLAAAFGSAEAVRTFIAGGADVRAAGSAGVTALHLAADDLAKTRMLLDAGADVNAASQLGRTPLIAAAASSQSAEVVRLLLARGANMNAADNSGVTALNAAANADNREAAELLLERGADPNAQARLPQAATPLMGAAINGNAALVNSLLSRKANVAVVSERTGAVVKNGPVRFGSVTALHLAATGGNPQVVESLLKAGAPVNAADTRGMTPLLFAVATDRPDPRIIRLLLANGADASIRGEGDESPIDWARKFNNPVVLSALGISPVDRVRLKADTTTTAVATSSSLATLSARDSVLRSLPLQRSSSSRVMTDGGCSACHAQPLTAIAIDTARGRGWTTLSSDVERAQVPTTLNAGLPQLLQLFEPGGTPDALLYATVVMAAQHAPPTRATDVFVRYLAAKQRVAGNWRGIGATRAPMQDGDFSRTAMAVRTLSYFATPARRTEYQKRVARAADWLAAQTPRTTEDRVMQLLGLHWANAHTSTLEKRVRELLQFQRADGGWAQTPHLASDAYATGQVLYTLSELGRTGIDADLRRASAFLVRTQRDDGTWYVKSRAMKIQPYFESGFPYGHDQWISQAATAWATIGLAGAPD
ncbi:MAG: ankyrin repeat domain-containing protein [Vicinamibacterales bacterium]